MRSAYSMCWSVLCLPLARTESQVLVLEFVVRQASAVVLRLHQPPAHGRLPCGHGHGPKEPWPAGLAVRGPGGRQGPAGSGPGPFCGLL